MLIAHRGLSDNKFRENTKDAIINSLEKNYVDGIEIDVRITKDNKIVVIHDRIINRTSDGTGFVRKMTLRKLRKFNFGSVDNPCKISTLKEILNVAKENKVILIEIKYEDDDFDNFISYFYRSIRSFLNKNIFIMSFNAKLIKSLKNNYPFLRCGILISSIINASYINCDLDFVAISSYSTWKVNNFNIPIFVWAINSKRKVLELMSSMNVSGPIYFIVDNPKSMFNYLKKS